ncbi:hypothetical protein GCM10023346_17190 [Arthrobacter gyeryongensis]|uniref:D-inositol 3-phosphate glycosyltransferase n=1 Tax=Arthrobacter gyeryongensis TaxID=1650592 RepID=A0ABP9S9P5_9MICC
MKRVVILQEYVPTYREPLFRQLIRLGEENGISICVAAGSPKGSQALRGDTSPADFVRPIRQRELRFAGRRMVFRQIGHYLEDADLVILEQARRNLDAYRMLLPNRRSSMVALWGHGKDYVKSTSRIEAYLNSLLTRRCDWFFAYTESGGHSVQNLGVPSTRVTVLRNSVDTKMIVQKSATISSTELAHFRDTRGLTDNVAVFVGGLDESKRIPFLLEAAEVAHSLDPSFRLLVVGDGVQRPLIEKAAETSDAVVYAGALFGAEKTRALLSAKVIAMPGRVGLIAVDSFAAGRPIVTTDWPWHAPEFEYLLPGIDSLTTEDDSRIYGESLLGLMNDTARLGFLQNNCQAKEADYSIEAMSQRYFEGISRALEVGGRN